MHLLEHLLQADMKPAPRLPDFIPGEEMSAPSDLPRSSQAVPMTACPGRPRLPDRRAEEAPE